MGRGMMANLLVPWILEKFLIAFGFFFTNIVCSALAPDGYATL